LYEGQVLPSRLASEMASKGSMMDTLKQGVAEFIGTFILVGVVVFTGNNTTAAAFTLAALVYFFQPISGGVFNPAVSLALSLRKGIKAGWMALLIVTLMQFVAGIIGAVTANHVQKDMSLVQHTTPNISDDHIQNWDPTVETFGKLIDCNDSAQVEKKWGKGSDGAPSPATVCQEHMDRYFAEEEAKLNGMKYIDPVVKALADKMDEATIQALGGQEKYAEALESKPVQANGELVSEATANLNRKERPFILVPDGLRRNPGYIGYGSAIYAESMGAFAITYGMLTLNEKQSEARRVGGALFVGFAYQGLAAAFQQISGAAFNPAIGVGTISAAAFEGYGMGGNRGALELSVRLETDSEEKEREDATSKWLDMQAKKAAEGNRRRLTKQYVRAFNDNGGRLKDGEQYYPWGGDQIWIYMLVPYVGAVLAWLLFSYLNPKQALNDDDVEEPSSRIMEKQETAGQGEEAEIASGERALSE